MFDKTFVINPDHRQALNNIAASNREHTKTLREISDDEIRARDRVDITLAEYEKMKKEIEHLKSENRQLRGVYERINLPILDILENSDIYDIRSDYNFDPVHFERTYRIMIFTKYY